MINQSKQEETNPLFKTDELLSAQQKSWAALDELRKLVKPGMNEVEGARLFHQVLIDLGSKRSWHYPVFRIGEGTAQPYHAHADEKRTLKDGEIYYIDIGPTWLGEDGLEYEGDVGDTFVYGERSNYQQCIAAAREIFVRACDYWQGQDANGIEIYRWIENEANMLQYMWVSDDDGHRISDFPHKRIYSGALASTHFKPTSGLWVLEVHISDRDKKFGAFFEDILR